MLKSKKEIGTYISKKLKEKEMSQSDLASEIANIMGDGFEKNTIKDNISKWIRGERYPGTEYLYYLAQSLKVSIEEILVAGEVCDKYDTRPLTLYTVGKSGSGEQLEKLMASKENNLPIGTNYDEYNKTVLDYALEFENINLIHYILEKKYLSFQNGMIKTSFRVDYSREVQYFEQFLTLALKYDDREIFKYVMNRICKINLKNDTECFSSNGGITITKEIIYDILNSKNILDYLSTPFIPSTEEFDSLNADIIYRNRKGEEELRVRDIETISPAFNLLLFIANSEKMEIAKKLIKIGKEHNSKALAQLNNVYPSTEYKIKNDGNVIALGVGAEELLFQSLTRLAGSVNSVGEFTLI